MGNRAQPGPPHLFANFLCPGLAIILRYAVLSICNSTHLQILTLTTEMRTCSAYFPLVAILMLELNHASIPWGSSTTCSGCSKRDDATGITLLKLRARRQSLLGLRGGETNSGCGGGSGNAVHSCSCSTPALQTHEAGKCQNHHENSGQIPEHRSDAPEVQVDGWDRGIQIRENMTRVEILEELIHERWMLEYSRTPGFLFQVPVVFFFMPRSSHNQFLYPITFLTTSGVGNNAYFFLCNVP